ncbi:hypothetical protein KBK19_07855 [Microvirga sp. STR05]|uniref:Lipoprotein n=1 Tax=Hymenobacter duratus TaxID=2771356 RepID=A0ABR8JDN5_9BACT|nr:hypothetical protein [Hymenobacter duratus]MBD2714945.1 hypothetical protein [Hymenobacter duratus]MBR7949851.1 hypothetical protein [Microvirga sp. STR05]
MKRSFTFLLALSLGAALTACDYNNTPGKDPQASQDFSDAPKATTNETDRDSLSGGQNVETPTGLGSAADQKTSTNAALEGAPSSPGSPTTTMPTESEEGRSTTREE